MTLKKYELIDLSAFCILAVIFDALNYFATTTVLGDYRLIFLSYSILLSLISIYRIGIKGIFVAICGALTTCLINSSSLSQYVAYIGGAISLIIPVIIFQYAIGRKNLKRNYVFIPYIIISFAFTILTRCIVLGLFNANTFLDTFISNLKVEIILESMSLVISIIILVILNRKKSKLIMWSVDYIKYVQDRAKLGHLKELQESPNFNSDRPFTEFGEIDNSNILDGGELTIKDLTELDDLYKSHLKHKE